MKSCAIVGINWGDEGKGRIVDLLSQDYDYVVRYQGGGNAGHTICNEYGKFALHLIPSGIFRDGVINVLGSGVALDPENLWNEIETLREKGVKVDETNLKISDRASILFPWHKELDALEEERLKDKKYGSTKQGIAPFYSDKYQKKTIMVGELIYSKHLKEHLKDILEWKNLIIKGVYNSQEFDFDEMYKWIEYYSEKLHPFICDTGKLLKDAVSNNKNILFEAQLGSLRDLDYGIYPYTTSSNTLASYIPIGSGASTINIVEVIGIVKAYSTCVGEGPFVSEWNGSDADMLREAGKEYGAKTGRARRVGPIDIVATRYGTMVQNATCIALTKLDVLSYMDKIPVCIKYKLNGELIDDFPFPSLLEDSEPVYEYLDGWKCDISNIRKWDDLPENARIYVEYIEKLIGCPIKYVSVGQERDAYIKR